jgi:hypothetical protein
MSYYDALTSFVDYAAAACATATPVPPLNASMRVAGTPTPVAVYDCTCTPVQHHPGTFSGHWAIEATITVIGDNLLEIANIADSIGGYFSSNPNFTPTTPSVSCRIGVETISFATGAESPDDGQQDAERTITISLTMQVREG